MSAARLLTERTSELFCHGDRLLVQPCSPSPVAGQQFRTSVEFSTQFSAVRDVLRLVLRVSTVTWEASRAGSEFLSNKL